MFTTGVILATICVLSYLWHPLLSDRKAVHREIEYITQALGL